MWKIVSNDENVVRMAGGDRSDELGQNATNHGSIDVHHGKPWTVEDNPRPIPCPSPSSASTPTS
jgi:hypothetical protein